MAATYHFREQLIMEPWFSYCIINIHIRCGDMQKHLLNG